MKPLHCLPLLLALLLASPLAAEIPLYGAKAMAMGEAGHSMSLDTSALYYNPAGITRVNRYGFGGNYRKDRYPGAAKGSLYDVTIVDSLTGGGGYGGGLGWLHQEIEPDGGDKLKRDTFSLGISWALGELLDIGTVSRYSMVNEADDKRTQWAGDVGFLLGTATGTLSIGAVWHNVWAKKDGAEKETFGDLPQRLGWGMSSNLYDVLTLAYDGTSNLERRHGAKERHSVGGELFFTALGLALRTGYIWDIETDRQFFTYGAALVAPKVSLGYSMKQAQGGPNDTSMMIEMTLNIPSM